MLVVFNLLSGPEKDEGMRWQQWNEMLKEMFVRHRPETFELFKAFAPSMLWEKRGELEISHPGQANAELWDHLKAQDGFERKPVRTKLCQFMSITSNSLALLSRWAEMAFKSSYLALELDMLTGSAFKKQIAIPAAAVEDASTVGTTAGCAKLDAKVLRAAAVNGVAFTVAVLDRRDTYRRQLAMMATATRPTKTNPGECAESHALYGRESEVAEGPAQVWFHGAGEGHLLRVEQSRRFRGDGLWTRG